MDVTPGVVGFSLAPVASWHPPRPVVTSVDFSSLPPVVSAALIDSVLEAWLGTAEPTEPIDPAQVGRWFRKDPELDALIARRFAPLVEHAASGELSGWEETPNGALALLILLDQWPRNLYRGSAQAFAADPLALDVAERSIARGFDRKVGFLPRMFFYLPLEHAEDPAKQERCIALFQTMAAEAPADLAKTAQGFVGYAEQHRDIIARFGRFPHRNAALGRASTPDEEAFVAQGGGF